MSKFSKELIASAHEALAIAEGRAEPARAVVMTVPFSKLSDQWKQEPDFVAEYERIGADTASAFALPEARRNKGL